MSSEVKTVTIIANPISGGRNRGKYLAHEVQERFARRGITSEIKVTTKRHEATEFARKAVEADQDMVAVIGGDGTINEVGAGLVGTQVPMALIPCGSGNGFARTLQIPGDVAGACELVFNGKHTLIDTGRANDRFFLLIAGFGFDAVVGKRFDESPKRGPLPYFYISMREYLSYRHEEMQLEINGTTREVRPFVIAIANGQEYGNNARVAPNAKLNDGVFDVCIIHQLRTLDLFEAMPKLFAGKLDEYSNAEWFRASSIRVHRANPGYVNVDGEPVMEGADVLVSLVPRSLKIVAPAGSRGLL